MPTPAGPWRPVQTTAPPPPPADVRLRPAGGRRRRRTVVATVALLAVTAAGGAGVLTARQLDRRHATPAEAASPGSRRGPAATATRPAAPLPPRLLVVGSHPAGAALTITTPGGATRKARTPFKGMVPGGELTLSLARPGFNRLDHRLLLDRARTLEFWLDPAGLLHHRLGGFSTGSNPKQVAFTPDSKQIWVTLLGGHGVQVFSAGSRRLLHQIRLGRHGAVEVIFTKDGRTAFASQMETASVFEIDRASFRVRRQLATKGTWSKVMALSPDERTLYVANWSSNDVSEIDLASGRVRRVLRTVPTPRGLYPTPDGRRLYVAGFDGGDLARIDLGTGRSKVLLHTGGAMRHLVGDPARGLLYADDMAAGQTWVVDLAGERVCKHARTDHTPNTIDLSPDGRVLYVSNRGRNGASYYLPGPEWGSVLAIDAASGRPLDAIVGGNQTTGLDVSPDGRLLAFSDFLDNRVQLFAIPPYQRLVTGHGGRATAHRPELEKS
jgi:YVTN family beta-propeller protein